MLFSMPDLSSTRKLESSSTLPCFCLRAKKKFLWEVPMCMTTHFVLLLPSSRSCSYYCFVLILTSQQFLTTLSYHKVWWALSIFFFFFVPDINETLCSSSPLDSVCNLSLGQYSSPSRVRYLPLHFFTHQTAFPLIPSVALYQRLYQSPDKWGLCNALI